MNFLALLIRAMSQYAVIINLTTSLPMVITTIIAEYCSDRLKMLEQRIIDNALCKNCLREMRDDRYEHCFVCLEGLYCGFCIRECRTCYGVACPTCTNFVTEHGCVACDAINDKIKPNAINRNDVVRQFSYIYLIECNKWTYDKMVSLTKYMNDADEEFVPKCITKHYVNTLIMCYDCSIDICDVCLIICEACDDVFCAKCASVNKCNHCVAIYNHLDDLNLDKSVHYKKYIEQLYDEYDGEDITEYIKMHPYRTK